MNIYLRYLYILFFSLVSSTGYSQGNLDKLMRQKENILNEIKKSENQISNYQTDISSTTLKLTSIQRQIKLKKNLLKKRTAEININKNIIKSHQSKIDSLEDTLTDLKSNYNSKVNGLYLNTIKNKGKIKTSSFFDNKSLLKIIYARQYTEACSDRGDEIRSNIAEIEMAKGKQVDLLNQNKSNLNKIKTEKKKFDSENKEAKSSISKMKSKTKSLKKDLDKYNKELKALENIISSAIKSSKKKKIDVKLSDDFAANSGIFSSPISDGRIISNFGEQPHPIISNVKIFNNGIDIISKTDRVDALFDGIVLSIQSIPGAGQAIIVQHGEYYTVYSKLVKTQVQIGDRVSTHQHIGNISTLAGENILHFELWKNQKRLDPENWISF